MDYSFCFFFLFPTSTQHSNPYTHTHTHTHTPQCLICIQSISGLPRWCSGKELACQSRIGKRCGFNPGSGRSPGVGDGWEPTSVFLPGESHGRRRQVVYGRWGQKESDMTEQLSVAQHNLFSIILCSSIIANRKTKGPLESEISCFQNHPRSR